MKTKNKAMDLNTAISKFKTGIKKWIILLIPAFIFVLTTLAVFPSEEKAAIAPDALAQLGSGALVLPLEKAQQAEVSPVHYLSDTAEMSLLPSERAEFKSPLNEWKALFNGENLDGWTPKFTGYDLGVNYNNTFRVEDHLLTVSYDDWTQFNGEFGHLFYKTPYAHYRIRATYRFIGEQVKGGAEWAIRNNGLMLHSQKPETMSKDQEFPVSIEVQLLGGNGKDQRSTANLCTPGTNVVMGDSLFTPHCTNSNSKTYHGDQWVTVEVEVEGDEIIKHFVNGEPVMQYTEPQYDKRDESAQPLISGENLLISSGYIAIQAESAPTQFKSIEIRQL